CVTRLSASSFSMLRPPRSSTLFPYTTLFRSIDHRLFSLPPVITTRNAEHAHEAGIAECLRQMFAVVAVVAINHQRTLAIAVFQRSEEHTSELQSRENLVCRLLLEKKKQKVN